jgi:formylglycine-generating enzyme required for sulfatase activity
MEAIDAIVELKPKLAQLSTTSKPASPPGVHPKVDFGESSSPDVEEVVKVIDRIDSKIPRHSPKPTEFSEVPLFKGDFGRSSSPKPLVIPEPDWKANEPILSNYVAKIDVSQLEDKAIELERHEDFDAAKQLWLKVSQLSPDHSQRSAALKAIAQINIKIARHARKPKKCSEVPKGDLGGLPSQMPIDKNIELRNELIAKSGIWSLVATGIKYNTEDESLRVIQQFAVAHRKELHDAFGIQIEEERIDSLGRMTHSPINVVGKLLREIGFTFHKVGRTGLPKRQYQYGVVYSSIFKFKYATIDQNREIKKHSRKAHDFRETINGVDFELVQILGGSFEMGSNETDYEKPIHRVTVPEFFMGKYPVTQAQWKIVANLEQKNRKLDPDPSIWKGAKRPVENVCWEDAMEFCNRLSAYTGKTYRLPSEAEWEYACRAGTTTQYHFGDAIDPALANYENNCRCTTNVGRFPGNPWGLFDCHGNIWEWCADVWHPNYNDAPTDGSPRIGTNTEDHSGRGGSWASPEGYSRSASRDSHARAGFYLDLVGFRLVLSVTGDSFKPPKSAIPNPNRF